MRISDWSSDVCSSDLEDRYRIGHREFLEEVAMAAVLECRDIFSRAFADLVLERAHLRGCKHRVQHSAHGSVTRGIKFGGDNIPILPDHLREIGIPLLDEIRSVQENCLDVRRTTEHPSG